MNISQRALVSIGVVVAAIAVIIAALAGLSGAFHGMAPSDATNYTARMAALIDDRPECQRFKDEILSYAKGSTLDGATMGPIVAAKQRANAAGCSHP